MTTRQFPEELKPQIQEVKAQLDQGLIAVSEFCIFLDQFRVTVRSQLIKDGKILNELIHLLPDDEVELFDPKAISEPYWI